MSENKFQQIANTTSFDFCASDVFHLSYSGISSSIVFTCSNESQWTTALAWNEAWSWLQDVDVSKNANA